MSRSGSAGVLCDMKFRSWVGFLLVALALACAAAVVAGEHHDRAKAAREAGQIVPLQSILDRMQAEFTGSPIEIDLEDEDGPWLYKVKLLTPAGAIVHLEYDARDGRLLRVKGRGAEAARRQR
jgi:Peptidase propeptide and YPEB domain